MTAEMGRHAKKYTDSQLARRTHVEAELSSIPAIPAAARKLTSAVGFADYYLEMRDLYQSYLEAYERLEDFHIAVAGRRRYAEFDTFRRTLRRYLDACARAAISKP
jgi:hypothetical protein